GRAVVGDVASDGLVLVTARRTSDLALDHLAGRDARRQRGAAADGEVLPREFPGRLDGLGTSRDEEDAIEVTGSERRDLGCELDRAWVGVRPVRVEGQLAHLLERRLADLLPEAVAEVDGEEAGERIEVSLPVDVLEVTAVAAHDDRRLRSAHLREM